MKINKEISTIISSGGNISDLTDGAARLALATTGLQSLAQTGLRLSHEIDNQFHSISNPAAVQDLYTEYQSALQDFSTLASRAGNIIKTAQAGGSLTVSQTETLERISEKANKVIKKLKDLKKELIRRRLEGDDEFDGRGGAAPMLLVSCEA